MSEFRKGLLDGAALGLGYFAVSFSLGIVARQAGLTPPLGFVTSFVTRASAGEYGVYSLIAAGASVLEVIAICCVANLRYILMGAALSRKFAPDMPQWKKILASLCITDEIFGLAIVRPGRLTASYPVGATIVAGTMWACGAACGIFAGNILPPVIVSALGVALYGMFLAIIMPVCRKDRAVAVAVIASFAVSAVCSKMSFFASVSQGIRIVVLTVVIAAVAAVLKPVKEDEGQ